ncbi:MAG: hypothetical protein D6712_17050 [Chloroflexi bacterium]|nr:MAG: hypothetical protein D6712_17050 [Chloroflexota bacterium]
MNYLEVEKVLRRACRLAEMAKNAKGTGVSWSCVFPDGERTTYILNEIKTREELEDQIFNAFIWFWNFKDYLKALLEKQGKNPDRIEKLVNNDIKLALCADIANSLKHGALTRSRSGMFPKLDSIGYTFPQNTIKKITIRGPEIELDFQNHAEIEIKMAILDSSKNVVGQALDYLAYGIGVWEKEFEAIKQDGGG